MVPGMRRVTFGHKRMMASDIAEERNVCQSIVERCRPRTRIRPANSLGMAPVFRPRKSLIWVDAISTAMPLVNPMVTGRGMYLTAVPSPVAPSRSELARPSE